MNQLKDYSVSDLNVLRAAIDKKITPAPYPGHLESYRELMPVWEKDNYDLLQMRKIVDIELMRRFQELASALVEEIKKDIE